MIKAFPLFSNTVHKFILLSLLVFLSGKAVVAQPSGNPFEIKPRLGQMPESTGPAAANVPTGNPFDIIAPGIEENATPLEKNAGRPLGGPDIIKMPGALDGFILGLAFFSIVFFTFLVTLFRPYFNKVFRSITNDKMLSQSYREYQQGRVWPYTVLYIMFMINGGVFLFLLLQRVYKTDLGFSHWQLLFLCISGVALAFLFKHFLLWLISSIFPLKKEIGLYNFTIIVFSIFIGIGLLVGNLALGLGAENALFPIAFGVYFFISIVYIIRSARGILIGSRFIPLYVFHFLLYICTAEIAPVLVVVKLIKNQLS